MDKDGGREIWDKMWSTPEEMDPDNFLKCVVQAVVDNTLGDLSGLKILEAGCGSGTSSFQLAKLGASVTLLDYSEAAIEKARRMFQKYDINADFMCSDIRNIKVDNNSYDVIFNSGVLEHFPYDQQVAMLAELARTCKPGGRVITMNPNARCIFYRFWKWVLESNDMWIYGYEQPVLTLINQFRDAGLRIHSEYSIGFDLAMEQFGSLGELRVTKEYLLNYYYQLPKSERQLFEGYMLCTVGTK